MRKIVVFEGIDGSGKSAQMRQLYYFLINNSQNVLALKEPGTTRIGSLIGEILKKYSYCDPVTQLFLIEASRNQMIKQKLENFDGFVLIDRYIYSTLAYQGYSFGVDINFINTIHSYIIKGYEPDIVFLLDVDPEIAYQRISKRGKIDHYEDLENLKRVRDAYLKLAEEYNFIVLDASRTINEIRSDVIRIVSEKFGIQIR